MEPDPPFGLGPTLTFSDLGIFLFDVTSIGICVVEGIDLFEEPEWNFRDVILYFIHRETLLVSITLPKGFLGDTVP